MALRYDREGYIVGTITKKDIEYELTNFLRLPRYGVKWNSLDERPQDWKHACVSVGVTQMQERYFTFADGSIVYFTYCPSCLTVTYFLQKQTRFSYY